MFSDKKGKEITIGCKITDGYNYPFTVIKYKEQLYADNGGCMFPLNSPNYNLKKFSIVE